MKACHEQRAAILAWLREHGPATPSEACKGAGVDCTAHAARQRLQGYERHGLVRPTGELRQQQAVYEVVADAPIPTPKNAGLLPDVKARLERQLRQAHRDRDVSLKDLARGAGVAREQLRRLAKSLGLDFNREARCTRSS